MKSILYKPESIFYAVVAAALAAVIALAAFLPGPQLTTPAHASTIQTTIPGFLAANYWNIINGPATGSQATATKAAGASGVHHVANCIGYSASSVVAPALSFVTVLVRDGTTGSGPALAGFDLTIDASAGQNVPSLSVCGLNLVGSAATAMTIEFSAGVTSVAETVWLTGFDSQ